MLQLETWHHAQDTSQLMATRLICMLFFKALLQMLLICGAGSAPVPESRLTAWQCDCGAPFRYSGKEMIPPPGGMTPLVAQVGWHQQCRCCAWLQSTQTLQLCHVL